MDKDDLFAEFLFNKAKAKTLNNLQQLTNDVEVSVSGVISSEIQSIFVEYLSQDDIVKSRQEEFLSFLRQEMPLLLLKFHKACNGKND